MTTTNTKPLPIHQQLAHELNIRAEQAQAAITLLDEGATVPFIARYRKEATGGLSDVALRDLETRLLYLRELNDRRSTILETIKAAGKLTPELSTQIYSADTKQRLEDLYAPYRPRRRTRAQIAREAGLEPLADQLIATQNDPETLAIQYLQPDTKFNDAKAVLEGARDILAERWSENADLLANLRNYLTKNAWLYSTVVEGKETEGANFRDWFHYSGRLLALPSHRALALFRGRSLGFLDLRLGLSPELDEQDPHPALLRIARYLKLKADFSESASAHGQWLARCCRWA
ncbi:MAG TPA: Tex-like N-terminal domain-containing protein, partial [Burkholderiaceae bacterium]|nr:Tex-like N-terminal domain-containing protein [Burkholderiaceae bacterium]